MRIVTDPIGGSSLTSAFLAGTAPKHWYPGTGVVENAAKVAGEFKGKAWLADLRGAFGSSGGVARERLERAAKGGLVVTTGQQPGLFGGPIYTLSKALTALALANELEKKTGLAAAPVFWAATDDADFAESSSIVIPSSDGALGLVVEKADDVQRPLAEEPLPEIKRVLDEFLRGVGSSSNAEIVELLCASYSQGSTVGSAYVRLLRGILEPLGISVLDAGHPNVRSAAHPFLIGALEKADAVSDALTRRNVEIKKAGFKSQVREVKGRSLVFRYTPNVKERITTASAGSASASEPGSLSATVLLRPIMERAILPTAAYVAGPAEIAYFAQVSAVAEALGAAQPFVVPRWSGTVIEPRVDRILSRYGLKVADFADPHALETRQARQSIPSEVQSLVVKLRDSVGSIPSAKTSVIKTGLISDSVMTGLERDISHRLERFERRAAAAVKRQGTQELRDIEAARASLYPLGKPQERAVSFVALLARYGTELITKMFDAAEKHTEKLV